jgi:hypothetical protein
VNFSSAVDADDIFVFLNLWFAQLSAAPPVDPAPPAVSTDFDGSGVIDADDIFTFLNLWFAGC